MTREPTKWRKISGVLIVALIATAFLVMTWGTVSAGEAEGTGLPDGWLLFLAGAPDASQSSVGSSPDTLRADGYSTATLTGQVQDALNAPVEGAFVCFTTTLGTVDSGIGYVEAESTSVVTEPVSPVGWSYLSTIAGASAGQYIEANAVISPTSKVFWNFTGDAVAVRYYKAPDAGIFELRVDAGTWHEIDPYAASGSWAEEAFSGFGAVAHTLEISVTNRKNASSNGYCTRLDLFRVGQISGPSGTVIGTLTSALFCSPVTQTGTVMATMIKDGTFITVTTPVTMQASVPTTVTVAVDAPKEMQVGGSTLGATVTVTDNFGLPVLDGTMVGFTTTLPNRATVPYEYVEVEDTSQVTRVGSWTLVTDTQYSGGNGLEAGSGDPSVVWNFTGTAVSLIYRRWGTSGEGRYVDADVDGSSTRTIDLSVGDASNDWRNEIVLFNNLSSGAHTLTVTKQSASNTVYLDALRSGTTTSGGQASATMTSGTEIGWVDVYADVPYGCLSEGARGYAEGSDSLAILAGSPASAVFQGLPYGTCCGQPAPSIPAATMPVTVTVSDAWSNPVANASVGFESSLIGSWPGGNPVLTGSNGEASTQYQGSESGTGVITATVDSVVITTTLTVTPGIPYSMTMSAVPAQIYASGSHTSTITLSSEDECGNAISDGMVVTFTTDQGTFPGSVTTITGTTSGGAASTVLTSSNSVVTATVTGEVGTLSDSLLVPFIAGDPFTVTATADPSMLPVGGSISTISAHVVDQYGTDVVNGTLVTFTTSGGDFGGSATTVETTHDGIATAKLSSGTLVETITVTATADSKFDTTTVSFEPGPPAFVTVAAIPPSLRIGWYGQWTAAMSATVRDRYLNLVKDGTAVEFIVVQTQRADVLPRWRNTVGGVATSTLYSKQTIGVATVHATSGLVSGNFNVMLTPGLPDSLTVSSDPPAILVGGKKAIVTADVRDIGGYHVEDGTLVTFATDKGDFAGLTISSSTTLNGLASVVLSSPNLRGTATITATTDGVVGYGSVTFVPGPPESVAISADDITLQLGEYGQFTTTIRVEVQDTYGNWVSDGHKVKLYATRGDVNPGTPLTHDGFAVSTLYSPSSGPPGWAQIWAQSGGALPEWVDVYYDIGPPYQISVAADPDAIDLVGRTSAITATIADIAGNLVADGTDVYFETDLGLVSPATTTTNLGLASTTLTSETTSGWAKVIARSDSKSGSVDVLFRSDPPWRILVTANPAEIPANGVSVSYINAYITDGYDNPVTDGTVVIFATDRGQVNGGDVYTTTTIGGICLAVLTSSPTPGLATVNVSTLNGRSGRDYVNFVEVRNYPVYMPVVMKNR
ncbi:MAG: invasin domain 3-containing protein [Chloroflexota bacterium]